MSHFSSFYSPPLFTTTSIASGSPLWNANKLFNFPIPTGVPSINQILKFNGSSWVFTIDASGGSTIGPFTTGSVLFGNGSIAEDNVNFFWDNTSKELGIGTNNPLSTLHLASGDLRLDNSITNGTVSFTVQEAYDHFNDSGNPHNVTASQVGNSVAQWNANQLQNIPIVSGIPTNGQILKYNGSEWTFALDASGDSSVMGPFADNVVIFSSGGQLIGQSEFNWDYENKFLGIQETVPLDSIHIGSGNLRIENGNLTDGTNSFTIQEVRDHLDMMTDNLHSVVVQLEENPTTPLTRFVYNNRYDGWIFDSSDSLITDFKLPSGVTQDAILNIQFLITETGAAPTPDVVLLTSGHYVGNGDVVANAQIQPIITTNNVTQDVGKLFTAQLNIDLGITSPDDRMSFEIIRDSDSFDGEIIMLKQAEFTYRS